MTTRKATGARKPARPPKRTPAPAGRRFVVRQPGREYSIRADHFTLEAGAIVFWRAGGPDKPDERIAAAPLDGTRLVEEDPRDDANSD